jgi:glycosyltransferase involved in cell wall biosynthesis
MRILYDGEVFRYQSFGGINRYFENIIRNLPAKFKPTVLTTVDSNVSQVSHPNLKVVRYGREHLNKISNRVNIQNFSYRLDLYTHKKLQEWGKYLTRREMESWDCMRRFRHFDVAHPTYYWRITKGEIGDYRCPVVITVWDMTYEVFGGDYLDPTGERKALKRKAIMSADALICISENTKQDLMRLFQIPESRITVTHLATHITSEMAHGPEPVPTRPYYLYVGSRHKHKNFDLLLEAFAKAVSRETNLCLCVVGAQPFDAEEKKAIVDLKLEKHVVSVAATTDTHLAKLYRCSIGLVYPSLYEGFGLPPLEAMACGTPAIVSRSSSLPEVIGDAGLYFDPHSVDELADLIVDFARDNSRRRELISKGLDRAKMFSWRKTAEETVRVYRSLVG